MRNLVPSHVRSAARAAEVTGNTPGTVLLVDIEGSTSLAAQLAPYSTEGAEALADVFAALFAPMVEEVAAEDGFVAEFAGDGVLAVFLGRPAEAVPRAVRAGARIMAAFDRFENFETPAGPARVTARGVVGTGDVEWRVWTAPHVDSGQDAAYTYLGSALAEAQQGEAFTPGGTLAVGPTARRHLGGSAALEELEDGFLATRWQVLAAAAAGSPPPLPSDEPPRTDDWAFFPASIAGAAERGEFRDVVTVFVELLTVPAADRSENTMVTLLDRIADHHGYLCDVIWTGLGSGVRALAFWGAPNSHEHDVGRALRFVADLRSTIGDGQLRAGVTKSVAFAGFVGTDRHVSYTCVGSGVNLAARICAAAEWGEIRVDRTVDVLLDKRWVRTELGGLTYRGFAQPIDTVLLDHIPPVRRSDPSGGAFVGREKEIAALERAVGQIWDTASPVVAVVEGEAGSGKSHLVSELHHRLEARTRRPVWLAAQADEIHTQPFETLRDALAGYFGGVAEADQRIALDTYVEGLLKSAPEMADELGRSRRTLGDLLNLPEDVAAASALDPKTRFENVVLAFADVISATSVSAPVIVSVADAQWLDQGTRDVLIRLRSDLSHSPLAIILESRNRLEEPAPDVRVELPPLGRGDLSDLAEQLLDAEPSADLVSFLADRSSGNVFFARQILEFMRRESLLNDGPGGIEPARDADTVPTDLRHILIARLDRLDEDVRRTVLTAAVLGREFDIAVLGEMLDDAGTARRHAGAAIEARLWATVDESRFLFRHALVRDTAYEMQLHAELRRLHVAAAEAIETIFGTDTSHAGELAYHLDRAGRGDLALPHYLAAGHIAANQFANREALDHFERVIELVDGAEAVTEFAALRGIHDVYAVLGDPSAQEHTLDRMQALIGNEGARPLDVAVLRGRLLAARGEYQAAETVVKEALDGAVGGGVDAERGALLLVLAQLARDQGDPTAAADLATSARHAFDAAHADDRSAYVEDFLGGIAWDRGDFVEASARHRAAAEVFHRAGDTIGEIRALNNLGSAVFGLGDYSAAREIHQQGAERSREIGYRMGEGDHLDNVGGTAWAVGDYDLARKRYSEALDIRERMEDAWGVAISKGNLGATFRAMGRTEEALGYYREALAIDRRIGRRRGEAYDLHGLGLVLLDRGDLDAAVSALDEAAAIRVDLGEVHLANESKVACATAMVRRGEKQSARKIVEEVLATEGDEPFAGAVETTSTMLRCIEVLQPTAPDRAAEMRARTASMVERRAELISDPLQRASYLAAVASHRHATVGDGDQGGPSP